MTNALYKNSISGNLFSVFFVSILIFGSSSCEKYFDIAPAKDELDRSAIFMSDDLANSAIAGVYYEMAASNVFTSGIPLAGGLSADEFIAMSPDLTDFQYNNLNATKGYVLDNIWAPCYKYIYFTNSIIDGVAQSSSLSETTKKQLEGEAKFIRAFNYFYLVNLFGDIPLILSTDYRVNRIAGRATQTNVYAQIVEDLLNAKNLLATNYSLFNNGRVRATKWAATALLARVYLYQKDWLKAEAESRLVIDNVDLFSVESFLDDAFLKNSREAIWQLMPSIEGFNTNEAQVFIATSTPSTIALSEELLNTFESNDKRRTEWIGNVEVGSDIYYFPYKYKLWFDATVVNEYSILLRLSEQYLIRAEALAQQDKLEDAIHDLDVIRARAGLPLIANTDPLIAKEDLLKKIKHERQVELFSEGIHRWLDLKRWNDADMVLGLIKENTWQSSDALYPIPQKERSNNPNLTQNDSY